MCISRIVISIRDLLSWTHFINLTAVTVQEENRMEVTGLHQLEPAMAYIHGACLTFLDALGSGLTSSLNAAETRDLSLAYLTRQMTTITGQEVSVVDLGGQARIHWTDEEFGVDNFFIARGKIFIK